MGTTFTTLTAVTGGNQYLESAMAAMQKMRDRARSMMTPMRFNTAMREGIKTLRTQTVGQWFGGDSDGCALATAIVGTGVQADQVESHQLYAEQMLVNCGLELGKAVACPHPKCEAESNWINIIMHLNDQHKWSREAIAEWVDPWPELHQPMPHANMGTGAVLDEQEVVYAAK